MKTRDKMFCSLSPYTCTVCHLSTLKSRVLLFFLFHSVVGSACFCTLLTQQSYQCRMQRCRCVAVWLWAVFQLASCKAWHWFGLRGSDWPEVIQMVSVPRGELELGLPAPSPKPRTSHGLSAQGHRIFFIILFFFVCSLCSFHGKICLLRCILIINV